MREGREAAVAAYRNRAFALGGVSNNVYGALRSLMALRQVLELGCGALVIPEQITVFRASEASAFRWCSTRPPVAIPLAEMMMRG